MNQQLERLRKNYEARVKRYAKDTHMPVHWVRPIVKAQITIEGLQERISRKMGALPQQVEERARQIGGDPKQDAEMIAVHGASQWAFAKSYLKLQEIDGLARGDSPF